MFEVGAVTYAQPSITKVGGVTEMRKVMTLAQAFGVHVVPHSAYFGPGLVASMHCIASLPRESLVERYDCDFAVNPLHDAIHPREGRIAVPQGPGADRKSGADRNSYPCGDHSTGPGGGRVLFHVREDGRKGFAPKPVERGKDSIKFSPLRGLLGAALFFGMIGGSLLARYLEWDDGSKALLHLAEVTFGGLTGVIFGEKLAIKDGS